MNASILIVKVENDNIYSFLEPQIIQKFEKKINAHSNLL